MSKLLSAEDGALLYRHLASVARHQIPFTKLFEVIRQDTDYFSEDIPVAQVMLDALGNDNSLPDAMARLPRLFAGETVALLRKAEQCGKLSETLDALADEQEWLATAGRAVKNATAWPITLLLFGGILVTLINIFVIPAFKELFSSFGVDLPVPTLILMEVSDAFVEYWWVLVLLVVGFWQAMRREMIPRGFFLFVERILLSVPFVRNYMMRAFWTRLLRWLELCEQQPELLPLALGHFKYTQKFLLFQSLLDQLVERLAAGQSLGQALDLLPPLPRRMAMQIQLGEMSGEMGPWIGQTLYMAEIELDGARARFERGIFLATYLVVGFTLGFVVIAMYLPIFAMGRVV